MNSVNRANAVDIQTMAPIRDEPIYQHT